MRCWRRLGQVAGAGPSCTVTHASLSCVAAQPRRPLRGLICDGARGRRRGLCSGYAGKTSTSADAQVPLVPVSTISGSDEDGLRPAETALAAATRRAHQLADVVGLRVESHALGPARVASTLQRVVAAQAALAQASRPARDAASANDAPLLFHSRATDATAPASSNKRGALQRARVELRSVRREWQDAAGAMVILDRDGTHSPQDATASPPASQWPPFAIAVTADRAELCDCTHAAATGASTLPQPVSIDFDAAAGHRGARKGRDPLVAAVLGAARSRSGATVETSPNRELLVIDATAGLGRDAAVLARAGCKVHMLERSPVVAALLADALARCTTSPLRERLSLEHCDSLDWLHARAATQSQSPRDDTEVADVVLLDPMFGALKAHRSAQPRKELQFLRRLLREPNRDDNAGADDLEGCAEHDEVHALLCAALRYRPRRVVVKRPARSRPVQVLLAEPASPVDFAPARVLPVASLGGTTARFDVYVPPPRAAGTFC